MKKILKNHNGSALVTVIVVVAFISILATTLLYVTSTNYQMKVADSKVKESFYEAEKPVDQVRADMVKLVSKTVEKIYPEMMVSLGARLDESDVKLTYQNLFLDTFKTDAETYIGTLTAFKPGITVVRNNEQIIIQGLEIEITNADGYTGVVKTDIVVVPPEIKWPYNYSLRSVPTASPATSEEVNFYHCVYFQNWEKK